MKIEANEILKEIEKQRVKSDDFVSCGFNIGLNTAITIVKFLDALAKVKGGK